MNDSSLRKSLPRKFSEGIQSESRPNDQTTSKVMSSSLDEAVNGPVVLLRFALAKALTAEKQFITYKPLIA